jgi:hypothetical protein
MLMLMFCRDVPNAGIKKYSQLASPIISDLHNTVQQLSFPLSVHVVHFEGFNLSLYISSL